MPVGLHNRERRMQVFNLPHELYCTASGQCGCREQRVTTVEEDPMTGDRRPRSQVRRLAASLTLLAREKREGLPEAVLKIPEVKRAVDAGQLRVLTPERPAPAPAPAATTSERKTTTGSTETRKTKDKERNKDTDT